jgi:hypothetical protein
VVSSSTTKLWRSTNVASLGFSGLVINSTAFVGIELLHVTKIVTSMGTEISPLA